MKRFLLAILMGMGFIAAASAQAVIDLHVGPGTSAASSYAYAGGANPLVGLALPVQNAVGLNTPLHNNETLVCDSCVLNFTTGNLTGSDTNNWYFGGGGNVTIVGGIPALGIPLGTTLVSGTFVSALVTGSGTTFHIAGSQFTDQKTQALAAYFGLGAPGVAGWNGIL